MKRNFLKVLPLSLVVLMVLFCSGCGEKEQPVEKEEETAKKESIEQIKVKEGNVVLAARDKGDWYTTGFHKAKIIGLPSDVTENKYKVNAPVGSGVVAKGSEWTTSEIIFKFHPAQKSEIKEGMVVLSPFDVHSKPIESEKFPKLTWFRARVISTDKLDEGIVKIETERPGLHRDSHIKNLRVSDVPKMKYPEELKKEK
jgi:hypothetical protein